MRMMFHVPSAATRFNEGDFGQWHKVVCAALDRDALAGGSVELMASSFVSYGLDPLAVTEQQERGRRAHAENFERRRLARTPPPTPEQFAAALMCSQGIVPQKGSDLTSLATATDAAYQYEVALNKLALADGYDFAAREHAGDWIDSQLLLYLADPEMVLVTSDRKLRDRVRSSPQAERIIIL